MLVGEFPFNVRYKNIGDQGNKHDSSEKTQNSAWSQSRTPLISGRVLLRWALGKGGTRGADDDPRGTGVSPSSGDLL